MTWNYRLMEFPVGKDGKVWEFRNVYYHPDGSLMGYGSVSFTPQCYMDWDTDPRDHFEWLLKVLKEALDKPILHPEDFKVG